MTNVAPNWPAELPIDAQPYPTDPFRAAQHAEARASVKVNELQAFAAAMEQLQRHLIDRFQRDGSGQLSSTLQAALELCAGHCMTFYRRGAQGALVPHMQVRRRDFTAPDPMWSEVACHAENACRRDALQIQDLVTAPQWKVAITSVRRPQGGTDAITIVLDRAAISDPMIGPLLQTVAFLVRLDEYRVAASQADRYAQSAFGAFEILQRTSQVTTLKEAAWRIANDLLEWQPVGRAAVGLMNLTQTRMAHIALSGLTSLEEHSPTSHAVKNALYETVRLRQAIVWQRDAELKQTRYTAHARLAEATQADWIVSVPFMGSSKSKADATTIEKLVAKSGQRPGTRSLSNSDATRTTLGAFLLWGKGDAPVSAMAQASSAIAPGIADMLDLVRERQYPLRYRLASRLHHRWAGTNQKRWLWGVGFGLLLLIHLPRPYVVPCDLTLRPVVRRFVAAPFDARLHRCLVRPGDVVAEGQTLAELDGKEMELEWSQRQAEYNAEAKKRDVAMAAQETAEAQQAQAQMERLQLQIELLEKQLGELAVKSPIAGVVLQGELRDAAGAPLNRGATLFEIGPLASLKAELLIADDDIEFVRMGSRAELYLQTGQTITQETRISHIDPAAQVLDSRNVFRAELELDNQAGTLRPGLSGKAHVFGPWRPWIWNVLRRPWIQLQAVWGVQ